MRKIIFGALLTSILTACSLNTSFLGAKSEAELVDGFNQLQSEFNQVFDERFHADTLSTVQDSLKLYFEALLEQYPESKFLPELLFDLGESSMKLKDGKGAINYFEQLIKEYPSDSDVARAAYFVAYTYQEVLKDEQRAIEAYKQVYKTYPDSKWAENAKNQVLFLNNPSFIGE